MNNKKKKYNLIAEIGCNHQGDISLAKEMILQAKNCGCNFVKFQKREPKLQFSPTTYNTPHPNPVNAFGKTYGEHREFLEFSREEHSELLKFAQEKGIEYSCSVFDKTSAQNIIDIQPSHIKIPSPVNNNLELVEFIAQNFNGTIHVSLGMTTITQEEATINVLKKFKKLKNTILYHCVSAYPTKYIDASLLELTRLKNKYSSTIKDLGISSHNLDYLPDCLALTLGAKYIEKHFTFDKLAKGSDHKISLDYNEMQQLSINLDKTVDCLSYKKKEILDCEFTTYEFHKHKHGVKNIEFSS